jgi:hypothetical protein
LRHHNYFQILIVAVFDTVIFFGGAEMPASSAGKMRRGVEMVNA